MAVAELWTHVLSHRNPVAIRCFWGVLHLFSIESGLRGLGVTNHGTGPLQVPDGVQIVEL